MQACAAGYALTYLIILKTSVSQPIEGSEPVADRRQEVVFQSGGCAGG
jgi:hypothetical protein